MSFISFWMGLGPGCTLKTAGAQTGDQKGGWQRAISGNTDSNGIIFQTIFHLTKSNWFMLFFVYFGASGTLQEINFLFKSLFLRLVFSKVSLNLH